MRVLLNTVGTSLLSHWKSEPEDLSDLRRRQIVAGIARLYRGHDKAGEQVLLNATGGYKAQISFAGIIGQVFGISVFYQFEDFPRAIKLPPLPVAFDLNDWLAYRHVFDARECIGTALLQWSF